MSEAPTTEAPTTEAPAAVPPVAPAESETPPWGADFDAARAWKTIQSQREAEKDLKGRLTAFEKAQAEREDSEKTEAQRLTDRLAKAEADLAEVARERLVAKVAKEHGVPDDVLDLLTGDTEDALVEKAKRLAALAGRKAAEEIPGKPKARLIPGEVLSDEGAAFDADAMAAKIRAAANY